jgi:hypothetical protein
MSDEDEIDFDELHEKAKKILKKLKEDSDRKK